MSAILVENTSARRNENKHNALILVGAKLAVFPSSGKVPLIKGYNKLDIEISAEERAAITERHKAENDGKQPVHIGATRDPKVIHDMWRAYPDAVPSISCGPSGLVVLDADIKDNGPELIGAVFEEHGGVPEGTPIIPSKSGGKHFVFRDHEGKYTNRAGLLKKQYGTDVRGNGGQFVAPGSMREDGKTYGTKKDLVNFLKAYVFRTIPELPTYVAELIGAPSGSDDPPPLSDSDPAVRGYIAELGAGERDDFATLFDTTIGRFPLDYIRECRPDFGFFLDHPGNDRSANRMKAASFLVGAYPEMTVCEYASFYDGDLDGFGEPDNRQLAREFARAKRDPANVTKQSDGSAFGSVDDEEESEVTQSLSESSRLADRYVYVENIRGAAIRLLEWCLKFFIARGTTSIATGLWGAGKTAVFSDIGLHVGHGFEWRGRKVNQGVVIYVALENSDDVERRVSTWCELMVKAGRDVSKGAFVVYRGPCRLYDPSGKPTRDEKDLIEVARTAAAHYDLPAAMIVIDTLAQSIAPGDDNSAKDTGIYTAAMQRVVAATGANVTVLAHPVKSGEGVRGSGALQANVDTVIEISRDASGKGTIKAGSKFRIGNPAKVKFGYRLQSRVIGKDDDGDDVDVVLAVEDRSSPNMEVDDIDDEAPTISPTDRREDRIRAVVEVFEREATRQKAADESLPASLKRIELQSGEIERAVNERRKADGLEALGRSTVQDHVRAAVEAGSLEAVGTKGRPIYRLA